MNYMLCGVIGGGYRLMHPFHPLDDKEEVMYDVYTTKGTLHWVGPSVEVLLMLT